MSALVQSIFLRVFKGVRGFKDFKVLNDLKEAPSGNNNPTMPPENNNWAMSSGSNRSLPDDLIPALFLLT